MCFDLFGFSPADDQLTDAVNLATAGLLAQSVIASFSGSGTVLDVRSVAFALDACAPNLLHRHTSRRACAGADSSRLCCSFRYLLNRVNAWLGLSATLHLASMLYMLGVTLLSLCRDPWVALTVMSVMGIFYPVVRAVPAESASGVEARLHRRHDSLSCCDIRRAGLFLRCRATRSR